MGKITAVSPLAPDHFPDLPVIDGVRFATIAAGVRYQGRTDVMLAELTPGSTVAGAFTRSATRAAPVLDCQAKIGATSDTGAAILVNSGNANAFTGKGGVIAVEAITAAVADVCNIPQSRVFTSSTGVIGEPLPHDRITAVLADLKGALSDKGISDAAKAIMTTDTFAKGARAEVEIDGKTVSIAGIAKGSGMIAPDMATMLVYIFTDAVVSQPALQKMLSTHTDSTFNCITVDSDTSTSDSLILAATGASGVDASESEAFSDALHGVMLNLAHQVVQDGEGATKFVEIAITGAATDADAKTHGMAIANSPLIKTAIAGQDPNWGRVVMAIGKSGAAADRDRLSIRFGDVEVAKDGWRSPDYSEEAAAAHMKGQNITIGVDLGLGDGKATVWTCDLTHGYIEINADYRS
ncbi:MAG: bifunctional glutamate N-acetyltransferase/amino-acid acetyltransferase ArgJ [Sulfitobacter litoralis]|jgi:glutamate N-acetyltransferase/amino-acid N-acetyltransferase|uniref:bifunctional glutamate N-acetyltransferase/amino-acid acetyltransferase ArgJ n=1 Tax=Sulfitobacter TaxID=60136 RepID=UPI001B637B1A|nr:MULTISPECIES: bifunctional glutamate N-acetyltransferase/amino-acid acetyltransferase ArgJ [Sulfitobacter]MBQ0765599.1 bifunctional glutamate N-acetyltransferase/amino-acid acetyltransferase ArgJ [Sulfitobacter litoralis]MCF7727354.1 bifunctional glutamate N-acetyltransferase/amino-acid acetyltransferase ArgJ [Sulfitobacter sp. M22]MCF7778716.1 bifunctional glutamate N-acetyltransferase/amino-acid acetyltransferase ArgJ [Sulfitobacter sp. M220]